MRFRQWRNARQSRRQERFGTRVRNRLLLIFSVRIFDSSVDRGIYLMEGRPEDALPEIKRIRYDAQRAFMYAMAY
jgi:hypothetical protein